MTSLRKGCDYGMVLKRLALSLECAIVYIVIGFEIFGMRWYFYPKAKKMIRKLGFEHLLHDSLEKAYNSTERKGIVLTPSRLMVTFKMNGNFGRIAIWSGAQWVRSEKMEELSLKQLSELCSMSDDELEQGLKEHTVCAKFVAF